MLPIAVGIPTFTNSQGLARLIPQLYQQTDVSVTLYLVCNHMDSWEECKRWKDWGARIFPPFDNVGVAGAWNKIARTAFQEFDCLVLLNDDVELLEPSVLSSMLWADRLWNHRALFTAGKDGWHAFCLPRELYQAIGPFDEGFWPAYYEDNDYSRRIKVYRSSMEKVCDLAGLPYRPVSGARLIEEAGILMSGKYEKPVTPIEQPFEELDMALPIKHHRAGSQLDRPDIKKWLEDSHDFVHQRYLAKWGGPAKQETFALPWNGGTALPSSREMMSKAGSGPL